MTPRIRAAVQLCGGTQPGENETSAAKASGTGDKACQKTAEPTLSGRARSVGT